MAKLDQCGNEEILRMYEVRKMGDGMREMMIQNAKCKIQDVGMDYEFRVMNYELCLNGASYAWASCAGTSVFGRSPKTLVPSYRQRTKT